jgi:hypothetical protein
MEQAVQKLKALTENAVGASRADHQAAVKQGLLVLLELKEESRQLAFSAEAAREETASFKGALEGAHLQLQNLLYEKDYYEKEIAECRGFRFSHPDAAIGLVPEAEFLQVRRRCVRPQPSAPVSPSLMPCYAPHGQLGLGSSGPVRPAGPRQHGRAGQAA